MSPIAHLVVTDAEHLRKLATLRIQLAGSGSTLHTAAARSEPLSARACPQLREDSRGATAGSGTPPSKTGRNGKAAGMGVKQ